MDSIVFWDVTPSSPVDVSEECNTSIFRVTDYVNELERRVHHSDLVVGCVFLVDRLTLRL
jgi:hypothetical protein